VKTNRELNSELIDLLQNFYLKNGICCENCKNEKDIPKHCISSLTHEPCIFHKTPQLLFREKGDKNL
jgi:hypothetical protein